MGCTGECGQSHGRVKPRERNFLRTTFVLLFILFRSRDYGTFRSPGRAVDLSYKHSKKNLYTMGHVFFTMEHVYENNSNNLGIPFWIGKK
jgi:hypothetical protein